MRYATLGETRVPRLGLGTMSMSAFYTGFGTDDDESARTIHRALDLGVTLFDTAEVYGPHTNEELLGRALQGRRDEAFVCTKFGLVENVERLAGFVSDRSPQPDSRPENIRIALEGSLRRLGTDHVDVLYQHRVDPHVPIEDVAGTVGELVSEGKVRHFGLSEAGPDTIRRAHQTHPVAMVQSEYSLWSRDVECAVLPTLRDLGIGLVAYSPLGHGALTGTLRSSADLDPDDARHGMPYLQAANLRENLALVDVVAELAGELGATPAQVALAWLLTRGEDIVPIPGTKRVSRLEENLASETLVLLPEQRRRLDDLPAPSGDRNHPDQMQLIEG